MRFKHIYILIIIITVMMIHIMRADGSSNKKPPNIVVIIADDMGFNDVSYHGSSEFFTPNIDALAYNGVILNRHYTAPLCTPTRSAFMTGKYPFNLGMQHGVILPHEPWGLGLDEKLLPQYLKEAGYETHLIGKWHLGFFKEIYTPTYRGFDSHFGYLGSHIDYYNHKTWFANQNYESGLDMRSNLTSNSTVNGRYATKLFTDVAIDLIEKHSLNGGKPLFLMLNHLAPHAGNTGNQLQAPAEEISKFSHIKDNDRQVLAAMISILDREIGRLIRKLDECSMLENSIIVFLSDNGAPTQGYLATSGSNFPLRGQKLTPFEGGIRTLSALWSPFLQRPGRVFNEYFHVVDWFPTLLEAAGVNLNFSSINGVSQWTAIHEGTASGKRNEVPINIDEKIPYSALIKDGFKVVNGSTNNGQYDYWMGVPEVGSEVANTTEYTRLVAESDVQNAISRAVAQNFTPDFNELQSTVSFSCETENRQNCSPLQSPCLFNLIDDPCERNNLALKYPEILENLLSRIEELKTKATQIRHKPSDPDSDPKFHANIWTWWRETEPNDRQLLLKAQIEVQNEIKFLQSH